MKTILILLSSLIICIGCEKKISSNLKVSTIDHVNAWIIKDKDNITIEIGYTTVSLSMYESIIKKCVDQNKAIELTINLTKDVEINNAHQALSIAEKCGVKTINIKLNQIHPTKPLHIEVN